MNEMRLDQGSYEGENEYYLVRAEGGCEVGQGRDRS